jgi:Ca2+-binding EF-hand superfamily protein
MSIHSLRSLLSRGAGSALLAAAAIVCITPDVVCAQGGKPKGDPEQTFKRRDADGDGFLTEAEFVAAAKDEERKSKMKKRFAKIDVNGDGKLSLEEFKSGVKAAG